MIKLIGIFVLLFTGACFGSEVAQKAESDPFALERNADVVIDYTPGKDAGKMKISLGPRIDSQPREVIREGKFSSDSKEFVRFFDEQARKNLIVIVYEKNVLDDAVCIAIARNLRDYFVARGFKRISIQQAAGGLSRPVYIDYNAEVVPGGRRTIGRLQTD